MISLILGLLMNVSEAAAVECPWARDESVEVRLWTGVVTVNGTPYSARRPSDEDELAEILEACDVRDAKRLLREWRHATGLAVGAAYLPYIGNLLAVIGIMNAIELNEALTEAIEDAHARTRAASAAAASAPAASAPAAPAPKSGAKAAPPPKATPKPAPPPKSAPQRAALDDRSFEDEE